MNSINKIIFWGMLISFLGSLPPGTMNIVSVHIASRQGKAEALVYALGSMLVEVIVVRLALISIKQVLRHYKLFMLLEFVTAALLLCITIGCFTAAGTKQSFDAILPHFNLPPFLTGAALSVTNPLHIPFWLGWTTVLMNKEILTPGNRQYNAYITGIGMGTLLGFITYIQAGEYLLKSFEANQFIICFVTGICLLVTLILHVKKMIVSPAGLRYAAIMKSN